MLWNTTKYKIALSKGEMSIRMASMVGVIQQLIIVPKDKETIWSVQLLDKDNDAIYERLEVEGRLDEKGHIPVGNQSTEDIILRIFDATKNDLFRVIVNVRELI